MAQAALPVVCKALQEHKLYKFFKSGPGRIKNFFKVTA